MGAQIQLLTACDGTVGKHDNNVFQHMLNTSLGPAAPGDNAAMARAPTKLKRGASAKQLRGLGVTVLSSS